MLKFLFQATRRKQVETQRQIAARLQDELNGLIDELPEKPRVTFDPASGNIELDLPKHLPDEALALPAPEKAA